MCDKGAVGQLVGVQEYGFVGDYQGHDADHQECGGLYCYFIDNHAAKVRFPSQIWVLRIHFSIILIPRLPVFPSLLTLSLFYL